MSLVPLSSMNGLRKALPSPPYSPQRRIVSRTGPGISADDLRVTGAPFHTTFILDGVEYFSDGEPAHARLPRDPFLPPGFEAERITRTLTGQKSIDEVVRRTNLMVQFVNSRISPASRYSQLQPKMRSDATFPTDFTVPYTVEEVRVSDPSVIDRILRAYGLPTDMSALQAIAHGSISMGTAHQVKLCTLFDFLGANQLAEWERLKRNPCLPC